MNVTTHEIDKMDDVRALMLARAQGPFGIETARRHSNSLMNRAMKAFDEGNVNAAIRLTTREFDFNCRAFGFSHAYTLASKNCLAALKQHYARTAWRSACSTLQLKAQRNRSEVVSRVS
jgi:hypothetical protein